MVDRDLVEDKVPDDLMADRKDVAELDLITVYSLKGIVLGDPVKDNEVKYTVENEDVTKEMTVKKEDTEKDTIIGDLYQPV
jgi:hypothetical protein